MVRVEDDEAFQVADGMALGAVVNGNLRIIAKVKGAETCIEIPHKWLKSPGGVLDFIRSECKPVGKQETKHD